MTAGRRKKKVVISQNKQKEKKRRKKDERKKISIIKSRTQRRFEPWKATAWWFKENGREGGAERRSRLKEASRQKGGKK